MGGERGKGAKYREGEREGMREGGGELGGKREINMKNENHTIVRRRAAQQRQ